MGSYTAAAAALGYGGMPFSASDYASVLSAYSNSLSSTSASILPNLDTTVTSTAGQSHTSPALSQSNRSSSGRPHSRSRQSTPQRSTPSSHPLLSAGSAGENGRHKGLSSSEHSPVKKPRLSATPERKNKHKELQTTTTSNFFDVSYVLFNCLYDCEIMKSLTT